MFKSILVAVDINDPTGASRCTQAAVNMARSEGIVLHVLNVIPDSGMAIVDAMLEPGHFAKMKEVTQKNLASWAKETIPEDVETKLHIARGTIYDQVIKSANEIGTDAIFVGAHSPELKDYLIGPNAARIARHAEQSVFVVR